MQPDPILNAVLALVVGLFMLRQMNFWGHIGPRRGCSECGAPEGTHWPNCSKVED